MGILGRIVFILRFLRVFCKMLFWLVEGLMLSFGVGVGVVFLRIFEVRLRRGMNGEMIVGI